MKLPRYQVPLKPRNTVPANHPFATLNPIDKAMCVQIGKRVAAIFKSRGVPLPGTVDPLAFIEVNPTIAEMDLAVVHLARNLDLRAMAAADDLAIAAEYREIQRNINRPLLFFPADVRLQFARR